MQVILIEKYGGPEVLKEAQLPIPKPGRDEVRVKIRSIGFNPVDTKMRSGVYPLKLPQVLGADFSGVIDAIGDRVDSFDEGDEVYGMACSQASNGTYAEFICLPHEFIAKKPRNLTHEAAAAVPVTYLTAFQALIGTGALQKNRPLFIAGGSGGVGSAAISLIKAYGGGPIYTMAGSDKSARHLMERFSIPADRIMRYKDLSYEEMVNYFPDRFYFTLDFVGGKAKELCVALADFNGHVASILPEDESFPLKTWGRKSNPFWEKSLSLHLIYSYAASRGNRENWKLYTSQLAHLTSLFESDELAPPCVEEMRGFSAKNVQEAHRHLEGKHTQGKLVMTGFGSKSR